METLWKTALWRQFGASIDMLDNALVACPDTLWKEPLWGELAQFWYLAYHALFWLDLYLSGPPLEEFVPPAPFTRSELEPEGLPPRPYTKEELRAYLAATRRKCHDTLVALTDEQARRPVSFPWSEGTSISYLELQLYNMRHVHEHAAQLSLFLGQHSIPDEALDWVPWAKDEA